MNSAVRRRWLWCVFFVSGAPGLMAQLAWSRVFAAGLGHEFPALTGVVSAYFIGLAVGAAAAGRWGVRWERPIRVYAGLEAWSALWIAGTTPWLTTWLEAAQRWMGIGAPGWQEAVVGFGLPLLVIGPAAAALGATLPAMEQAVRPLEDHGRAVSGLYAWNTVGALAGIGAAMGVLMPLFGFRTTLLMAAGLQLVCSGAAVILAGGNRIHGPGKVPILTRNRSESLQGGNERSWVGVLFVSGFLGIGFEILGVRALAQTTENTVQTYAVVLGSVLTGTAIGAAWDRRQVRRGKEWDSAVLLGGLAVLCAQAVWVMGWSGTLLKLLRGGWGGLIGEALVAAAVFVLPSAGMGMVFARWVQRAGEKEGGVGRAVAWNCLGAALAAPALLGFLPYLGLKGALLGVSAGYLLLVPWSAWRRGRWILPLTFGGVAAGVPLGVRFLELPEGASLVRSWDGKMASVAVIRTGDGERVLRVNNHFQQGGTATAVAARRHAHIPLLIHPAPKSVLFLGIGTGITMGAAADHPDLKAEGVELLPEVVEALSSFEPENRSPRRRNGFDVRIGDARRHVRTTERTYDVIIADLFHPGEDGAGMLYTREHFQAIRERLAPGGLFCQWLPLHQLDEGGFRDVGVTFLEVFPEASLWLLRFNVDIPVLGLVGGLEPRRIRPEDLARRMGDGELSAALKPVALGDPVRLLGCRIADATSLRRMVLGGRIATDDLPWVMYGAAAAVYRHRSSPHERLMKVLATAEPGFEGCLDLAGQEGWAKRLESFRSARDRHLHGLGEELAGRMREALEDYVASAGLSAEYTAGYAQAVLVASAYAKQDSGFARSVLERLVQVRPEQGLARELLGRMGR